MTEKKSPAENPKAGTGMGMRLCGRRAESLEHRRGSVPGNVLEQ